MVEFFWLDAVAVATENLWYTQRMIVLHEPEFTGKESALVQDFIDFTFVAWADR